jgi:demethoxyubiquinone hydroxylase (CLK1/Coq7/Cat5 family)
MDKTGKILNIIGSFFGFMAGVGTALIGAGLAELFTIHYR